MNPLAAQHCEPCEKKNVKPFDRTQALEQLKELSDWKLSEDATQIQKTYRFKNFVDAMDFANAITDIAELEGHHPDLGIAWGKVEVSLSTHSINGLSKNDFILAAKIDAIPRT